MNHCNHFHVFVIQSLQSKVTIKMSAEEKAGSRARLISPDANCSAPDVHGMRWISTGNAVKLREVIISGAQQKRADNLSSRVGRKDEGDSVVRRVTSKRRVSPICHKKIQRKLQNVWRSLGWGVFVMATSSR